MITLQKTGWGIHMVAPGYITEDAARAWRDDLHRLLADMPAPFGLLVDIRTQRANPPETQTIIQDVMRSLREKGLQRSAVVLDSALALRQLVRLSQSTGVYAYERYLDANTTPDWERRALDWIQHGREPEAPRGA